MRYRFILAVIMYYINWNISLADILFSHDTFDYSKMTRSGFYQKYYNFDYINTPGKYEGK